MTVISFWMYIFSRGAFEDINQFFPRFPVGRTKTCSFHTCCNRKLTENRTHDFSDRERVCVLLTRRCLWMYRKHSGALGDKGAPLVCPFELYFSGYNLSFVNNHVKTDYCLFHSYLSVQEFLYV